MRTIHFILTGIISLAAATTHAQSNNATKDTQEASEQASLSLPDIKSNALEWGATQEEEDGELKEQMKEQRKIEAENALLRARLEKELADLRAEIERLRINKEYRTLKWEMEQEEQQKEHAQAMLELTREREKLMAEVAVSQAKLAQTMEQFNLISAELQNKAMLLKAEADELRAEMDQAKIKKERARFADGEPVYLDEPLQKEGTLVVSDRCISLNGVLTPWKGNYIVDQIRYFNNKDNKKPIFIVIGYSPGGSALAGSRILKAMESSQAPVYVVVKSFAASMAALITTLAKKSYAYPNAMVLHHQPWTFAIGNLREMKEQYEMLQEWWRRLGEPVAKKMGISLSKLDKQLYEKSASGDWTEFADNAKKLKWVDHIIEGVDDSAIREKPEAANYTFESWWKECYGLEITPAQAADPVVYLPPLGPKDFYYLYNPDNRYQVRSVQ